MLKRISVALATAGAVALLAIIIRQAAVQPAIITVSPPGPSPEPSDAPSTPTTSPGSTAESGDEAVLMLALVNEARCKEGLIPLTLNPLLTQAARAHSHAMAEQNFFDHINPLDGTGPGDRIRAAGYDWYAMGENIAAGGATVEGTFEQWWNSPPHQETMLYPDFREMGLGHVYEAGSESQHYWTQTFGTLREDYGEPPRVNCVSPDPASPLR